MATSMTPVTSLPITPIDIAGSFTPSNSQIRMSGALTSSGEDTMVLVRQNGTGYWEQVEGARLQLAHRSGDIAGASKSIDVVVNDTSKYHVLSLSGFGVAGGVAALENLTPALGIVSPAVSGDTVALLAAAQTFTNKTITAPTLTTPVIAAGLTASGSASNDFSGSTGTFKTSSGAGTLSGHTTLAAGKNLVGAAGAGALTLGSMTGDTGLPTGALAWSGASGKAAAFICTGAAITLTADAASVWKTTTGALTVDSAAALNLGTVSSTSQSAGKSGTTWTFNGKVAAGATAGLIADPGASGAISVATDGVCALTSAGAETRTLAIPTYVNQRLTLCCDTYVGNIVVTVASAFDSATHTTITLSAAGKAISLVGVTVGGTRAWRLVGNDGCTLG